ncbi:SH3 domain-containing protein [Streptomyces sp. JNUCC 64]
MSLRTPARATAIAAAAVALALAAAVPATAAPDDANATAVTTGATSPTGATHTTTTTPAPDAPVTTGAPGAASTAPQGAATGNEDRHHYYKGRITARSGLLLRDSPTRGSRVLRKEPHGAIVSIYCKTRGDRVEGNDLWYLLTDGTWAWGAAHYIDNIGKVPHYC